jgi:hypothetical protein
LAWRAQFCEEHGALKDKFQSEPLVASFLRDPNDAGGFARDSMPVPNGRVATW